MARDITRFQSNERVDLEDFRALVDETLQDNLRHAGAQFWADPTKQRQWIIDGFVLSNPTGEQIQVTLGRAILGQREGGQIFQGVLASEGDTTRTLDAATLADASYGIFIRFEYVEGDSSSRAFWNPQGNGSEFAQTIPTRRIANWSLRIEVASPGAEWFQMGKLIVSGSVIDTGAGGLVAIHDFFFEGKRDADIAPATPVDNGTQFESGWSTDGNGGALDRNADRELNGVKDLQTFTAAMRQCVEDIKGRGLRRWWDRDIGGLNIGFDANPTEDVLAVGDANLTFEFNSGDGQLVFDHVGGAIDAMRYDRSSNEFIWFVGGTSEAQLNETGMSIANGLNVGFLGSAADEVIAVGDSQFTMDFNSGDPRIVFEDAGGGSENALLFDRSSNRFDWYVSGIVRAELNSAAFVLNNLGFSMGFTDVAPTTGQARFFDTNFNLALESNKPTVNFDPNDKLFYDRSINALQTLVGSTIVSDLRATQKARLKLATFLSGSVTNSGVQSLGSTTIPAGVVQVGSVVRISCVTDTAAFSAASAHRYKVSVDDGAGSVDVVAVENPTPDLSSDANFEACIAIKTLATQGGIRSGALLGYSHSSGTQETQVDNSVLLDGFSGQDTTAALTIDITVELVGGNSGDTVDLILAEISLDL